MYMTMKKGIQLFYKKMCTFKVSGEFRFDLNENWNKLDVLSVEDKLIGLEYVLISKSFNLFCSLFCINIFQAIRKGRFSQRIIQAVEAPWLGGGREVSNNQKGWLAIAKLKPLSLFISLF